MNVTGHWGIAYNTYSNARAAKRYYYLSRLTRCDGEWWELARHSRISGGNRASVFELAASEGLTVLDGIFSVAPEPRKGATMQWSLDK